MLIIHVFSQKEDRQIHVCVYCKAWCYLGKWKDREAGIIAATDMTDRGRPNLSYSLFFLRRSGRTWQGMNVGRGEQ
jgi:hypothetical protein